MSPEDEGKSASSGQEIPDVLPLLPVRDLVVFPYMIAPLRVSRPISLDAVNQALATEERMCFIVAQRDSTEEDPKPTSLYRTGTVGIIMRMRKLSDGGIKILVQGLCRARIQRFLADVPSYRVRLDVIEEARTPSSVEVEALVRTVKQNVERVAELGRTVQPELALVLQNVDEPGRMSDLVASNLTLKLEEAQTILETEEPVARLTKVNQSLENEIGILEMQNRIQSRAKEEMSKTQRDYYLREQLRQIRHELGDDNSFRDEIEEVRHKIESAGLPAEARAEADKQLRRLEQMSSESAEAAVVRSYLDLVVDLPWKESETAPVDLVSARKVLDEDHYDLEHVKDRILDYLAVFKLRKDGRGPILCFLGPPGVGKTSLGRSIARALGRKFVRISLGGVRDEAEIRGHRRTYVGALPGPHPARTQDRGNQESRLHARRGGQARIGLSRRPLRGLAGSPGSGTESHLPRPLPGRGLTTCRRCCSLPPPISRTPSRRRCAIAWRPCAWLATARKRSWSSPSATFCPSRSARLA